MPEIVWIPLALYSAAALTLLEFFAVRSGRIRKWPERHYYANGSKQFAAIGPGAISLALLATTVLAAQLPRPWIYLSLACLCATFAVGGVALYWTRQPPEFVKPPWLKDAERRERECLPPQPPADVFGETILVGPIYFWASWAGLAACLLGFVILNQPAFLIGAGVGAGYIATLRPRRKVRHSPGDDPPVRSKS